MRIEKVVIGMDFSDAAIAAATWVSEAFAPEGQLIFVHALEPEVDRFLPQATYATSLEASVQEAASERSREIARQVAPGRTRIEVQSGRAHDVLHDVAAAVDADLIVVGPHGEHSPRSRWLGTTADRLVRTTRTAVLIAGRPRAGTIKKRIVAGVDASSITASVLAWAAYASTVLDAKVTALYALKPVPSSHALAVARSGATDEVVAAAEAALAIRTEKEWLRGESRIAGIDDARLDCDVLYGDPAEWILETARREDASLVVVGRRDPVPLMPALLGRTLRHVLHEADCPVLVATQRDEALVGDRR
jgi:nucleotide-binding universal stress UspA family protein